MARRSTRLSARKSSTPQPQRVSSLSHDEILRTPRTAPRLASLAESEEMPGAFPRDSSPAYDTPTKLAAHIADAVTGSYRTPKQTTPIKPSVEEMHPKQFQTSTAKPLEEARWLGFSNMAPHTEPPKRADRFVPAAGTPSKTPKADSTARQSDFQFTFRAQSLELSNEARQMMAEKREEATRIKEQMMEEEASQKDIDAAVARKMATPKGKVGRFSDVHMAQFKNMDSIAKHAAASRPTPSSSLRQPTESSLKRTSSKAGLAQGGRGGPKSIPEEQESPNKHSHLPRSNSVKSLHRPAETSSSSPAKRFKRVMEDDASTNRPASSGSDKSGASTPKGLRLHANNPHLGGATTPTKSFLARQGSVKSNKTSMIPSITRSPSKPTLNTTQVEQQKPSISLLARSPSKLKLPSVKDEDVEMEASASPLLSKSPVKPMQKISTSIEQEEEVTASSKIPYLARSPSKISVSQHVAHYEEKPSETPLLARSPSKMSASQHADNEEKPSKTPLLARSPAKASKETNPFAPENTPARSGETTLMDRLRMLRASPMKSILRSPQRLYSDDPLKIASGTHVATPEKAAATSRKSHLAVPPQTDPVRRRVDFTASTKDFDAGEDSSPQTPSRETAPALRDVQTVAQAKFFYPPLPSEHTDKPASVKKFNRRMTLGANAPGDFTFRVGGGISFAPSTTSKNPNLKASIRHVSAEPELITTPSSRKRKFDHDSDVANPIQTPGSVTSDKENNVDEPEREEDPRPAKRVKAGENHAVKAVKTVEKPVVSSAPAVKKIPTLGVKPKNAPKSSTAGAKPKDKKPGFLSQTRLNMLAMPKRRHGE